MVVKRRIEEDRSGCKRMGGGSERKGEGGEVGRKRSKRRGDIQHFMNNGRKKRSSAQAEHGGRFFVFYVSLLRSIRCRPALQPPTATNVRRASSEPTRHRSLRVRVLMISCDEIFILMWNGPAITPFHSRCTPFLLFLSSVMISSCKTSGTGRSIFFRMKM